MQSKRYKSFMAWYTSLYTRKIHSKIIRGGSRTVSSCLQYGNEFQTVIANWREEDNSTSSRGVSLP